MIGFYITMFFGYAISWLPFPLLYLFSDFITFLLKYVVRYRKRVIMGNLRRAFPEKNEVELNKIRSQFYKNFSDTLVESFKSLTINKKQMQKHFRVNNPEVFDALHKKGKGVIIVMGHYANFEWTATFIPQFVPHQSFAVFKPLKNKYFNKQIIAIRERFGLTLFPIADTYPFMLNNSAKTPLYVFMADQSPRRSKIKYSTTFLNTETPMHLGVENLSRKCDLAVVFIEVIRYKRGHYEVTAELLYEDVNDVPQFEITDTHAKALEKLIKKKPQDWLWSHKRWKHVK